MSEIAIAIIAGGSGGHIFPASVLMKTLMERGNNCTFFTDKRFYKFPKNRSFKNEPSIDCINIKRTHFKTVLPVLFHILSMIIKFIKSKPDIIIGFGGYCTFPAVVAGAILRIPVLLHEQNAIIGRVNSVMQKFSSGVITCFEKIQNADTSKTIFLGNPIGQNFKLTKYPYTSTDDVFTILVIGGSQGTAAFDTLIPEIITSVQSENLKRINIYHQCGAQNSDKVSTIYAKVGIKAILSPFFGNISELIKGASLIISRAGATSIAEISSVGRPAIFIPYPDAVYDHQRINAECVVQKGAALLFNQKTLKTINVTKEIEDLMSDPIQCMKMAENSAKLSKRNSEDQISDFIEEFLSKRQSS